MCLAQRRQRKPKNQNKNKCPKKKGDRKDQGQENKKGQLDKINDKYYGTLPSIAIIY